MIYIVCTLEFRINNKHVAFLFYFGKCFPPRLFSPNITKKIPPTFPFFHITDFKIVPTYTFIRTSRLFGTLKHTLVPTYSFIRTSRIFGTLEHTYKPLVYHIQLYVCNVSIHMQLFVAVHWKCYRSAHHLRWICQQSLLEPNITPFLGP